MDSPARAEGRLRESQVSTQSDNPSPAWNALKHGLGSTAILLPDDDALEFERLRRDLFHTYRPRTADEAACVEAMAAHHWRIARCRRWETAYDAQTDALLTGDPSGLAGHICETDTHRWLHKAMDCTLQESRLDRLLCRARDKLLLLQKLRRNNLVAGAVEREPIFWPSESPPPGAVSPPQGGGLGGYEAVSPPQGGGLGGNGGGIGPATGDPNGLSVPASPSLDGEITKSDERDGIPPEPIPASPWRRADSAGAPTPCQQGEEFQSDTPLGADTFSAHSHGSPPSLARGTGGVTPPSLARGTAPALAGPREVTRSVPRALPAGGNSVRQVGADWRRDFSPPFVFPEESA